MYSVWHEMFKIALITGAPPQTPLRELTTVPQTPYMVVRGFLPSAIAASRLRRLQFPVLEGGENCFHHSGEIDVTGTSYPGMATPKKDCSYHGL